MRKLTPQEIWPPAVYESIRDDFRRQVIAYKKNRRIDVGPFMTLIFEDRTTVKFQIQEILRAEKVSTPEGIAEEVEGFNTMIPEDNHLSATLLISSASEAEAKQRLAGLVGLKDALFLEIGEEKIKATFDAGRENDHQVSAVQYLDFALTEKAKSALFGLVPCRVAIRHPNYKVEVELPEALRNSLRQDLQTS